MNFLEVKCAIWKARVVISYKPKAEIAATSRNLSSLTTQSLWPAADTTAKHLVPTEVRIIVH